ncbi:MAG: S8 family serine peptidase [Gammaproteobacteria bacterium]|nr:S8 family serine peptidase [Gammaproteobacteria bacterium]
MRAAEGGFDALAQGIIFAADHGARVINLSLSGRKTSQVMTDAIAYATGKGSLIVAAAGNSGGAVEYPAAYPEVLAVGSVEFQLQRAGYANFGPQIDVVAPGGDTRVDANGDGYPDGILQRDLQGADPTRFALYYLEGTLLAAPHVSAVAALLFAVSPSASPIQVCQAIEATARDLGSAGRDNDFGYGLVQAASALALMGLSSRPHTAATHRHAVAHRSGGNRHADTSATTTHRHGNCAGAHYADSHRITDTSAATTHGSTGYAGTVHDDDTGGDWWRGVDPQRRF